MKEKELGVIDPIDRFVLRGCDGFGDGEAIQRAIGMQHLHGLTGMDGVAHLDHTAALHGGLGDIAHDGGFTG